MTNQEINNSIHRQLTAAAQRLFEELKEKIFPGNYTAKELYYQFATVDFRRDHREELTLSAGTFSVTILLCDVFRVLNDWETNFIKKADRAAFVREDEKTVLASCTIVFPKETKHIAEYAATDTIRPMMCGVLIDCTNNCMVASDCHILTEIPLEVSDIQGEPIKQTIEPKVIKELAGQECKMELLDTDKGNVRITTAGGKKYVTNAIKGRYPDYRRVMPKVNRDGLFELSKDGVKTLATFVKTIIKQTKDRREGNAEIIIEIPAYSEVGTARYMDKDYDKCHECKFYIKGSPRINVCFGVHAWLLATVMKNWDGSAWFSDPCRAIVFDNTNTTCTLIFPMLAEFRIQAGHCDGVVDAIRRHGVNYDIALSESKVPAKQTPKTPDCTALLSEVARLVETTGTAMFALQTELTAYYQTKVFNLLDIVTDMFADLGKLLDMVAKFIDFALAAEVAGVELDFTPKETDAEPPKSASNNSADKVVVSTTETPAETEYGNNAAVVVVIKKGGVGIIPTYRPRRRLPVVAPTFEPPGTDTAVRPPPRHTVHPLLLYHKHYHPTHNKPDRHDHNRSCSVDHPYSLDSNRSSPRLPHCIFRQHIVWHFVLHSAPIHSNRHLQTLQ